MTAFTHDSHEEDFDIYEERDDDGLPGRPRRQFFNRRSAALAALITCALGFYGGVRVEKGQVGGTTSAGAGGFSLPTGAGGFPLPTGAGGAAAAGRRATSGTRARAPGGASPFGAGNASFGTVSDVNGKTLHITDVSGNTVKVTLSPATKLSKTVPVSRTSVRPGDSVVIQGLKNSAGTLIATSLSDSGASTTSSTSSSSRSSAGGSAVNSLFGSASGG